MTTQKPRYLAFMLRLWQVRDDGGIVWRASLEDAQSGERRGFASLEMLLEFLHEQLGTAPQTRDQANELTLS